jgi:GAF domain-containing protein
VLGTYHLNGLFDILKEIHFIYEPEKLWKFVLEQACKILQAEAGTFFLSTKQDTELEVAAAHGVDVERLKQIPFRSGVGICGWVLQYHQAALVTDVELDNRFSRSVDAVTGVRTHSVLCVPVLSQKRTYGVLELINKKSGQFNPQDQEFMTVLGRQTAAAYQNLLLYGEVTHAKTLLQSVLENLSGGLITIDIKGDVTIMNSAAARLLDITTPNPVGQPVRDVLKDHAWFIEILNKTLADKSTVSRQEINLMLRGKDSRVGYTTILVKDPKKELLGSGIIFQQLSSA